MDLLGEEEVGRARVISYHKICNILPKHSCFLLCLYTLKLTWAVGGEGHETPEQWFCDQE